MKIHFHFHLNFAARNAIYAIFKTFFICVFLALISENLKYEYGKQFKVMPKMISSSVKGRRALNLYAV